MNRWILPILFITFGLFLWHLMVTWLQVPEFLLPTPRGVLVEMLSRPEYYWTQAYHTTFVASIGYGLAILVGIGLAALFSWSQTIERGLYPYVLLIKIIPTVAIAPLLILWLGIGTASKLTTVILICFFPIFVAALKGFKSVDDGLLDLFRTYHASRLQKLLHLSLPSSLPYLFPALKISLLLSFTGALIGEFVSSNKGLGYVILYGLRVYDSQVMFAAIMTLAVFGLLAYGLLGLLERKVVFWQRHEGL